MQAAMEIMLNQTAEEDDADFDEMGVAETYSIYWPAKLTFGKRHPDPVVETCSLSSVEPCDIHYKLSIPQETIQSGSLSALQLESITYASQAHEHELSDCTRAGFLIGDGAGVGKGRTVAGIIFENYQHGRKKALWISVSNDLKYDAERDLSDIGASEIKVHALNKLKYANIVADGVLFSTYSALIGKTSMRNAKHKTRLSQILQWCGDDFDGLIIFDECHKAKNLCPVNNRLPSKTGVTVLELQNSLPQARVVYASATGASEPKNMAYMVRLGIWGPGTPFRAFCNFIQDVEERGVGFMEIVAMDMKLRGMYIARQLSFREVTFKIEEVPFTEKFRAVYDESVALWVEALEKFKEAATLVDTEGLIGRTMWAQFWASHQRFFKYLCIAAKVSHAVRVAREAIKQGKCVVIGLQSTGEARTLEQLEKEEGELNEFVSTAKGVFQALVEKQFPAPDFDPTFRVLEVSLDEKYPASVKKEEKPTVSLLSKRRSAAENAAAKISRLSSSSGVECDRNSGDSTDSDLNTLSCYAGPLTIKLNSERISQGIFVPKKSPQSSADSDFSSGSDDSESDSKTKFSRNTRKRKMSTRKSGVTKKLSSTQIKIRKIVQQNKEQKYIVPKVEGSENKPSSRPIKTAMERAYSMKEELLGKIELLGHRLPPNTLDQLIDELGGPEHVAEMTGRKGRVVQKQYGDIQYESRSELDIPVERLNLTEKQRFMDGEKDIAIISEAASSGISLQSDRRVSNQRRRVHITLELPWSADRAIQQFGRTHRSNQVNAPEYVFLISDLAGERRFASTVAKRLESLGALTHGDRRATETRDLSEFNIDNKYGKNALETVMESIMDHRAPLIPPPTDYEGNFFKDIAEALLGVGLIVHNEARQGVRCLDKDYDNISKFLNRILGIPVGLQNRLFKYFTDTLEEIIMQAKQSGRFDLGILDLGTAGDNVTPVKLLKFFRQHATGSAPTEVHTVRVERGLTCQEALAIYNSTTAKRSFYLSYYKRNNNYTAILAVEIVEATQPRYKNNAGSKISKNDIMFEVYRPNTGLQIRLESLAELEKKYRKVKMEEAEPHWMQHYEASVHTCSHTYWNGSCKRVTVGFDCEFGLRQRLYTVLSGSVLAIWLRVERIFKLRKMQVIRLKTTGGQRIVGTLVPKSVIQGLIRDLQSDADKTEELLF